MAREDKDEDEERQFFVGRQGASSLDRTPIATRDHVKDDHRGVQGLQVQKSSISTLCGLASPFYRVTLLQRRDFVFVESSE